jgi:hypothetical protein
MLDPTIKATIKYDRHQTQHAHAEYQSLTGSLDSANIFDPMHFILVWNEWKFTCLIISSGSEDWNPHDSHKQAYTPAKYTSCFQFHKTCTFILYVLFLYGSAVPMMSCYCTFNKWAALFSAICILSRYITWTLSVRPTGSTFWTVNITVLSDVMSCHVILLMLLPLPHYCNHADSIMLCNTDPPHHQEVLYI